MLSRIANLATMLLGASIPLCAWLLVDNSEARVPALLLAVLGVILMGYGAISDKSRASYAVLATSYMFLPELQ